MSIRVLIADDSRVMRLALSSILENDPRMEVVGRAADGVEALALTKQLRPDVVTMDVRMPHLDGLEATAAIMATTPARILMVCSVYESEQQDLSFRAMEAGALEVIAKPHEGGLDGLNAWGRHVADSIALMAEVPVVTRRRSPEARLRAPESPPALRAASARLRAASGRTRIVGIAASTGGPPALALVLADLPKDLPFPILLAQHMAPGFASGLVRWLASVTPLTVCIASEGIPLAGHVYVPPDSHDLAVDAAGYLRVTRSPQGVCPSANRLLRSLAQTFGASAAGFVLTGMGDDGAEGLAEIRRAGGQTFAQDERTSVVYGMPQVAFTIGAARTVLPIDAIAGAIRALALTPSSEELS
jgi:two-component system chemotaxis response regulator CheB